MGNRDGLLGEIRDHMAILEGQQARLNDSKTPADKVSAMEEIRRQKAYIANKKSEWMSQNRGKPFPFWTPQ